MDNIIAIKSPINQPNSEGKITVKIMKIPPNIKTFPPNIWVFFQTLLELSVQGVRMPKNQLGLTLPK